MRKTASPNPGMIMVAADRIVKDGSILQGKPPCKISTLPLDNATSLALGTAGRHSLSER